MAQSAYNKNRKCKKPSAFERFQLHGNRKAQVWYIDFIVSVLIFTIVILIYFEYVNNLSKEEQSDLETMVMSAKIVSNNLMSGGFPDDWNQSNAAIIGVVDDERINSTKMERFYDMGHEQARIKFGIIDNYYAYLQDRNGQKINFGGKDHCGEEPENPDKLVKIDRIVIYNNDMAKMVVQIWR
jgi:hypothetical protein